MPKSRQETSTPAVCRQQAGTKLADAPPNERTKRAQTRARLSASRARSQLSRRRKIRITPDDKKLEVRIFLAAVAAGQPIREAAKLAGLTERRIQRWVAFNGFLPVVQEAQHTARILKDDPCSRQASDAGVELTLALQDRVLRDTADRYAGGDLERLDEMWQSGELMLIYDREAIAGLRRCGKHRLADRYERAMAAVGSHGQ